MTNDYAALCADFMKHPEVQDAKGTGEEKKKEIEEWHLIVWETSYRAGDKKAIDEHKMWIQATEEALKCLPENLWTKHKWKQNEWIAWNIPDR